MKKELIAGIVGTCITGVGTAIQTEEVLRIISLVLTILGTIITFIVMPLINWYQKANADKKITLDEIKEGVEILEQGTEKIKEDIEKEKEK